MANVKPGYMGVAQIGDQYVRCSAFSPNVNQDVLFYDHVIGLNDVGYSGSSTKGENPGEIQTQKNTWRPGTLVIQGEISFPITEYTTDIFYNSAKDGSYIDEIILMYYCADLGQRRFSNCRINSYALTATAGEVVTASVNFYATKLVEESGSLSYTSSEKLMTWDKFNLSIPTITNEISSFNFTINNNIQTIFTADPVKNSHLDQDNPYGVKDLRVGMQEVTGEVVIYLNTYQHLNLSSLTNKTTITYFEDKQIDCVFKPKAIQGLVGPVVVNIPFVGVDKALGP